jgi:hypothetical protein
MDMTQIDEQWIDLPRVRNRNDDIVAISNTGKYRRRDSTEGTLKLRQNVTYEGKHEYCYHIIAEHFLITVRRPDQNCIDHITHHPTEYNINDVRNLRWCTNIENNNFEEARANKSGEKCSRYYGKGYLEEGEKNPMYGKIKELSPRWKGDSAKAPAKYRRALKEYRKNSTPENLARLVEARSSRMEYITNLRING